MNTTQPVGKTVVVSVRFEEVHCGVGMRIDETGEEYVLV